MESNGKFVTSNNTQVNYSTGPIGNSLIYKKNSVSI